MTSSGSRPPESSQTSHRFTRCRVTSKFGFARLMPDRSSRNTRAALYRGPPIASQYSWNDARYAVGFNWPSSQRTPVTVATRTGKCSRILRAIRGSVWTGRIGIVRTPFLAALGSAAHNPFFSRSNCARASGVSKKMGSPSRSEEHTSELQSPFLISYAVFCLKKKKKKHLKSSIYHKTTKQKKITK